MIDRGVPPRDAWPDGILESLSSWEQGDLVADPPFFYFADPAVPIWEATRSYTADSTEPEVILPADEYVPPYALVTTQTCDIAEEESRRPIRPWVQIAPVYQLTTWKRKKLEGGKGPQYWLLIPDMPEDGVWVADFRIELPVEKSWLAQQTRVHGFVDEAEKRDVGKRLEWLRGRPAFSRGVIAVHQTLFEAFQALEVANPVLEDRLMQHLKKVVVQVDSYLAPSIAQLVFLTSAPMPNDCQDWLEEWRDGASAAANASGIALQALDFRTLDSISVLEYRRMSRIW